MPQANITYESPYNKKLVHLLNEMDEKHWRKAGTAYAPTMFQEKLGNFHGEKIGGGSPAGQKYIISGNSPAYPPINMNSGMAVHSGGAYAGIDGAVGGYSFNDFLGDAGNVGKELLPLAPLLMGLGRKKKGGAKCGGSSVGDTLAGIAKTLVPFAPLLMGLGHPAPKKKADVVKGLHHLGAKPSHTIKKLMTLIEPYKMKTGGYSLDDFIGDFNKIGNVIKPVAQPIISALTNKAVGKINGAGRRKKGGASSGGASLASMVEMVRPMDMVKSKGKGGMFLGDFGDFGKKCKGGYSFGKFLSDVGNTGKSVGKAIINNPIVQEVGKDLAKEGIKMGKDALLDYAKGKKGAGSGGRSKRAEIVKKVMREKGMKMIEASKYVKAHSLYKP